MPRNNFQLATLAAAALIAGNPDPVLGPRKGYVKQSASKNKKDKRKAAKKARKRNRH